MVVPKKVMNLMGSQSGSNKSSDDFQNELDLGQKNLTLLDLGFFLTEPEDV